MPLRLANNFLFSICVINLVSCRQLPSNEKRDINSITVTDSADYKSLNSREILFDTISYDKISINTYELGDILSENQMISKFGVPDSFHTYKNEIDGGEQVYDYYYKKSKITIQDLKLEHFDISDDKFYLDKLNIRIGDPREKIFRMFPNSFDAKEPDVIEVHITESDRTIIFTFEKGILNGFYLTNPDDC